jgi:DMSO/TMAO reductase YedYZ molybdopterin-dependent catalytic subunit
MGLVTGLVAVGSAQLVAGLVNPESSPIVGVGQASIDATPEWLKSFAIRTFGSHDKDALLTGIAIVLALIAVGLGIASVRRLRIGLAGLVVFGLIGVLASLTRPTSKPVDALPSIVGAIAGAFALLKLHESLVGSYGISETPGDGSGSAGMGAGAGSGTVDRRRFLTTAGVGAFAGILAAGVGRVSGNRFEATASRADVSIPPPASPVPAASVAGEDLHIAGLSPFITPNSKFYRVDTSLLVPSVTAENWKLHIHGMVDHEMTINYKQLVARPLMEADITLCCVSNEVGGQYIGNARWVGASMKDLLEEAGVQQGATQLVSRSVDGFTIGTPTAVVMDGRHAMLAVQMNGEALPLSHGFPVRQVVPGLYGYVSATKWVVDWELTTFEAFDAYWVQRGWAQQGPVKTESRIDTPQSSASLKAGKVVVAGVAWAQHTGIKGVDVRIDNGAWVPARLSTQDTIDTWRQWVYEWEATPGNHTVSCRATDLSGYTQTDVPAKPFPSGATGLPMFTYLVQ